MSLLRYRKSRGLSQARASAELGLASTGYFSRLESGRAPMPLKLALRIEQWSDGQVPATELLHGEELELLQAALRRRRPPAAEPRALTEARATL